MKNIPPEKPKPKTRKKDLAGTLSAFLAPVPRNTEKFTDAGGERFTRLSAPLAVTESNWAQSLAKALDFPAARARRRLSASFG